MLARIPEQYRERVRREAAEAAALAKTEHQDAEERAVAAEAARDEVLAKYHAIADEADTCAAVADPAHEGIERARVWARHMNAAQSDYERGVADERRRTLAFLRREEQKFEREATGAEPLAERRGLTDEQRARCAAKASILRTMIGYLERGDHETEKT